METSAGERYLDTLYADISLTAARNSDVARVDTIGYATGTGSYPIKRIIITGSDLSKCTVTEKPRILITGATHGDEQISAEVAVRLAAYLVEQYQADDNDNSTAITALLDTCEIHIIPVLNPWGVVNDRVKIDEVITDGRYTAAGIDINRDFGSPDPDASVPLGWLRPWYGGFAAKESSILRELCEKERYILSIQGHTGAENINLPMDYLGYKIVVEETGDIEYLDLDMYIPIYPLMETFAESYTTSLQAAGLEDFYYTEGYDWYGITGSFTDWHFGALGAPGYTIEYDTYQGQTSEEYANSVWLEHRDALINLLGITTHRISGQVTNSAGEAVEALLTFQRHPDRSRASGDPIPITLSVRSDPKTGYYHILIPDGVWDITAAASGYDPYTGTVNKPVIDPSTGTDPLIQNIQLAAPR